MLEIQELLKSEEMESISNWPEIIDLMISYKKQEYKDRVDQFIENQ